MRSTVGWMNMIGHGSKCIKYPQTLFTTSDLPTCDDVFKTTFETVGSLKASIHSFAYGTRDVRHLPGSALASALKMRYLSAHSETVKAPAGITARAASLKI